MDINESVRADVITRLRRARGQIDGVIAMIEDERSCVEIVTQLSAAAKAVDRAGFKLIANGIRQCVNEGDSEEITSAKLEKLFMSLA